MNTGLTAPSSKRSISNRYVIGCLSLCALGIVGFITFHVILGPWPRPPLWQIQRVTSIEFPKSAQLLNSYGRTFLEVSVWAKIEIDEADVEPFIKSLPRLSPATESDRFSFLYRSNWSWWNPRDAKQSKYYIRHDFSDPRMNISYDVFINLDDPRKAIVFLKCARF